MIEFRRASLRYGNERPSLVETDLEIGPGLTMILGPNGAGKSSLLKLAAGVERPWQGQVLIDGHDLWTDEVNSRRRLAYVPEYPDLTPYATVGEVIQLVCRLRDMPLIDGDEALARAGLALESHKTIRELSLGQRRRALLAAAFIGNAPNVLLDEPLEGLDRAMQEDLVAWVVGRVGAGGTVLLATHELEPFAALVSRVVALRDGATKLLETVPAALEDRLRFMVALAHGRST